MRFMPPRAAAGTLDGAVANIAGQVARSHSASQAVYDVINALSVRVYRK